MRQKDKFVVLDIIEATGMFTPEEIACAREQIDIFLEKPEQRDYLVVVAENEQGKVVGYMSYGTTPLTEGAYDLYWMAVSPVEQGRGYGRELVRWLESRVQEKGGRLILIETSSQDKYARTRQFYLNLGYKEVSRIPDFYKPGDNKITFAKYFRPKERE